MKKILAALLVLALVAPAMADVAVTAADLGSGHLRITVSPSGGAAVRGVALVLERTGDATVASTAAVTATGLNTFIDYALTQGASYTAVGQGHPAAKWDLPGGEAVFPADSAKFSLCAGYLDENGVDPKGEGYAVDSFFDVYYTAGAAGSATIAISLDSIRGGIVGDTLGTVTVQASQVIVFGYTLTTSSTTGGNVTTPGEGTYTNQTGSVAIVATADPLYHFVNWTGDTANINNVNATSTTINMIADASIVANFAADPEAITTPTVTKTTAAPAISTRVNSGRSETFVASGAVNNYGHAMEYNFTYGDTTTSGWGAATRTKTYTYGGAGIVKTTPYAYNVTVQARCIAHPTVLSAASTVLALTSEPVKSSVTAVYAAWASFNRPNCWAFQRNCRGDIDGLGTGFGTAKVWVNSTDLTTFAAAFNKQETPLRTVTNGICADNDRAGTGFGTAKVWVNTTDLGVFSGAFNDQQTLVLVCVQTNYHYWTN